MRTWKWLALRAIGRPSVPWFGRGGQTKSAAGGGCNNSGIPAGSPAKGKVGGGTEITKQSLSHLRYKFHFVNQQ